MSGFFPWGGGWFGEGPTLLTTTPPTTAATSRTPGPLPYLAYCGVEIANGARTYEYLKNGLGSPRIELSDAGPCSVLYRLDGASCETPNVFVAPSFDPAPWFDASEPGSGQFLGVILLDIQGYDSTVYRTVTSRTFGLGGGTFGPMQRRARVWKFRAALISSGDAGAEYGLRWLTGALEAAECDTCETCDLTVRLVCPEDDCSDDTLGEWFSYDVALVDGPNEVAKYAPGGATNALQGCREIVEVEWTMAAGDPYLYKRPVACLSAMTVGATANCTNICDFLFGDPGPAKTCGVTPPRRKNQIVGGVFTFTSTSGMGLILLQAFDANPTGLPATATPTLEMAISGVPAGGTVVVDASRHEVTVTEGGVTSDGQSLIVLPTESGAVQWIEVRDCDDIHYLAARTAHPCSQGADTTVTIDTQLREG